VGYALLADLVMVLHFTFLACVVFGGSLHSSEVGGRAGENRVH
jgi:hypothetical protein